jgi:hypothetical protein
MEPGGLTLRRVGWGLSPVETGWFSSPPRPFRAGCEHGRGSRLRFDGADAAGADPGGTCRPWSAPGSSRQRISPRVEGSPLVLEQTTQHSRGYPLVLEQCAALGGLIHRVVAIGSGLVCRVVDFGVGFRPRSTPRCPEQRWSTVDSGMWPDVSGWRDSACREGAGGWCSRDGTRSSGPDGCGR